MKAQPLGEWWIVETDELGSTACPGELFAQQAAEVVRGAPYRLKVLAIRPANPRSVGDALAIKQSEQEMREVLMDHAQRSGVLAHRHHAKRDTGRVILVPKRLAAIEPAASPACGIRSIVAQ